MEKSDPLFIAFAGDQRLVTGSLTKVALKAKESFDTHPLSRLLVFNAATSEQIDFDFHGTPAQVLNRLTADTSAVPRLADETRTERVAPAGPGRPKLGVVAREITLLPRHWEWLSTQPGGASVALRKLVEQAKRSSSSADRVRQSQNASFRFMSAMTGDLDGFEEATRALFAADRPHFEALIARWPADVREHLHGLAELAFRPDAEPDAQDV